MENTTIQEFTNDYFNAMHQVGVGYENARATRKAEKEILMSENRWDEVKAWNEREKSFPFPFSQGYLKAYYSWYNSKENESSFFEVAELPWARDAHDFISCLKEAGVTEFAITDHSTALMELLHVFAEEENCKMQGLCKVTRTENRWGETGTETYDGILMRI